VLVQDQLVVTETDGRRLRGMIGSVRESLRTVGDPYEIYLRGLEGQLARRSLVPPADVGNDVVTMNSKIRVKDLDTGRSQELTLVYERDADLLGENISVLAPLGAAVLGARVGDVVRWQSRRGPRRVRIEQILFQPEAAGKFDL
jgi:regulator of nucleoside diphosphate kinase